MHGGHAGRPVIHGRYSLQHRESLQAKAERFLSDGNPGDLTGELALLRALLQDFLERFPEGVNMPMDAIQSVYFMAGEIGRKVERVGRILNSTALTQAEVHLLQARLADLVVKYIDDPDKRLAFVDEAQAAFGHVERHSGEGSFIGRVA